MSYSRFLGCLATPLLALACLSGCQQHAAPAVVASPPPAAAETSPTAWWEVDQAKASASNALIRYAHGTTSSGSGIVAFTDLRNGEDRALCLNAVAGGPAARITRSTANDQFLEMEVQVGSASHIERLYRDLPVVEIESGQAVRTIDVLSTIPQGEITGFADCSYRDHRIYGLLDPKTGHGIGFVAPTGAQLTVDLEKGPCFILDPAAAPKPFKRWIFAVHNGKDELRNTGMALVNGLVLDRGPTTRATVAKRNKGEVRTPVPAVLGYTKLPWGSFSFGTDSAGHLEVLLENSVVRMAITQFRGWDCEEHAIRELVLKRPSGANQGGRFIDAASGREMLSYAQVVEATNQVLTTEVTYDNGRVSQFSIFPDSPVVRIRYVQGNVNICDIGSPGGIAEGAQYVIYGAEGWRRPLVCHPDVYFTRTPAHAHASKPGEPAVALDPDDGGSLNYHGFYLLGLYNPANGQGFGRVIPVHRIALFKLLEYRGFEIVPGRLTMDKGPSTQYLFVFNGGSDAVLPMAKAIADGNLRPRISVPTTGKAITAAVSH